MNIHIRQAMSLVLLFGGFTWGLSAHAGPSQLQLSEPNTGDSAGLGNSGSGGSSGGGSGSASLSVPCIGSSGKVMNADPASVCQAILPKCADLRTGIEDKVKNLLSMKIYGFYSGYNLDLHTSTTETPKGDKLQNPICSLVGQKMENHGSTSDFEITSESISKAASSCGMPPRIDVSNKGKRRIEIFYDSTGGSQWAAYLQGAYPWLIRKKAYEVFQKLDANLTNLNSVISDAGMNKDLQTLSSQMSQFYQGLSETAKSSCQDTKDGENLIDQCKKGTLSVNDPVARICKLVVAQIAANDSAIPNMLISEIMDGDDGVFDRYDAIFGQLLNFSNTSSHSGSTSGSNSTMKNFAKSCADTSEAFRSKKKKMAMTASCLAGKKMCISGKCATVEAHVQVSNGKIVKLPVRMPSYTNAKGVPAVIERLVRHDVCGQNVATDKSVCDTIDIPSKPDGVKW